VDLPVRPLHSRPGGWKTVCLTLHKYNIG